MLRPIIRFVNSLLPKRYRNEFGFWGEVAKLALQYGPAIYGAIKGAKGGDEGGGVGQMIQTPDYYEDDDYRDTQDYLKSYGTNMLEGNVPDYYKAIGETGSPEFEAMLGKTNRDIMQGTSEALAKGGRARGGQLAASTAKAVADSSTEARYGDYARSLIGKQNLLKMGAGITEGVRDAGQNEGRYVNAFNWRDYDARFDQFKYQNELAEKAAGDKGGFLGNILEIGQNMIGSNSGQSLLGTIGNLFKKTPSTTVENVGYDEWGNPMSMAT